MKSLDELKAEKFPEEGREERIRRSLEALRLPPLINISLEQWKQILEEEFLDE
jgi:hypothetical protein